ncbi:MAG: hypothetical protein QOE11_509 [Solirubrobacteraceae bacterium]|nr:hypothetical protein [Solirubrobacteraceae bacterium]
MLTALVLAALVAGVAGAWSPCGFSMVDTLGPDGYAGSMRVTAIACVAFAAGALAGAVATFGGLALLGAALGTGGAVAGALAAAVLLAAAAGDAGGRRIVPQVRRQVPESWRRVLPVPLAAGLYGVLLGLGFTTFVLSFGVYALAGACLALGDPGAGVAVGVAFAAGRIAPVVTLAPLQATARGVGLAGAMGDSPAVLRGIRATGAVALAAAALVLVLGGAPATAAPPASLTNAGTDPSAAGGTVAWQLPGGGAGMLQRPGAAAVQLPGADAALGPGDIVWREGAELVVASQDTLAVALRVAAPGAEEPAISDRWLVWRAHEGAADVLRAVDLLAPGAAPVELRRVIAPDRIGRPSIDGNRAVFHIATRGASRIEEVFVPTRRRAVLRRARSGALLLNPSELGGQLLYVRSSPQGQEVLLGPRRDRSAAADRRLYRTHPTVRRDAGHEPGHHRHGAGYPGGRAPRLPPRAPAGVDLTLWTTALARGAAYVTSIRRAGGATTTQILAIRRR